MQNVVDNFDIIEIRAAIIEKLQTFRKKNKNQKIKIIIKVAITSTKVACIIRTFVIALAFYNLII